MKYWSIIFILIIFSSCQNVKQPEKPKNLIGKEMMVDIMTEAYLANAARSVDNKTIMEKGIQMDSLFYNKFGVDSLQFAKSNAFYAADVNAYITIFQEVEKRLNHMEVELDSTRKTQILSTDSIPNKVGRPPNLKPSEDR